MNDYIMYSRMNDYIMSNLCKPVRNLQEDYTSFIVILNWYILFIKVYNFSKPPVNDYIMSNLYKPSMNDHIMHEDYTSFITILNWYIL